jgi:hypothetical protein
VACVRNITVRKVRHHYPVTLPAQDVQSAQEKPTKHELNRNTWKKKYGHIPSEALFQSYALLQIRVKYSNAEPQRRTLPDSLGNSRCRAYLQKPIMYTLLQALLITDFISKNSRLQ